VSSGGGLERDSFHAGDFDEAFAERLDDLQRSLRNLLGLIGMAVGNAFDPGHGFIHARIVFHGAGAERVHPEIDRIIPRRHPGEVADNFNLADLGHVAKVFSFG
jgi:hypothetical protein